MARKINDYLSEHKNEDVVWEDVRIMLKNYVLKHNTISWSHKEINIFNDELENELKNNDIYNKQFGDYIS